MIVKRIDAIERKGENTTIANYLTKDSSNNVSLALSTLSGRHAKTMNKISDRIYYILNGSGKVWVGDEVSTIEKEDMVFIPKGTPHAIEGNVAYLVINSPPFEPANEVQLE